MSNPNIQLYDYHAWANNIVFDHLRKMPDELWNKNVTSVFPSICDLMSHIYAVDMMWLSVMKGSSFEEARTLVIHLIEESKGENLGNMEKRFIDSENKYREFLNDCDTEKVITLSHPVNGSANTPLSKLVQHVVNHGTYHRGNLTAMLRQLGHSGVPTDYIFYLYK